MNEKKKIIKNYYQKNYKMKKTCCLYVPSDAERAKWYEKLNKNKTKK